MQQRKWKGSSTTREDKGENNAASKGRHVQSSSTMKDTAAAQTRKRSKKTPRQHTKKQRNKQANQAAQCLCHLNEPEGWLQL